MKKPKAWQSEELLDEKCTHYFFNRIKDRRVKNVIRQVKNKNGNLVSSPTTVLSVFHEFTKFYTPPFQAMKSYRKLF